MAEPLDIYCDESGQTGPNLLDPDQRIFTYAGVAATDAEAWPLLDGLRRKHGILDNELKAKDLLKSQNGRLFVLDVLTALEGRYSIVAYDKALALGAKVFEYVYEPVFQDNPELVYRKGLHRFVAMYCYTYLTSNDDYGAEVVRQFLAFMRSYDPGKAPLLFGSHGPGGAQDNPFEMVAAFANGYRNIIVSDNQSERDALRPGTLTLDLTASGLFSLLRHFGKQERPLAVTCDNNPQLAQVTPHLVGGEDDPSMRRARRLFASEELTDWTISRPIAFDDSRNRPALQLADIVAGTASAVGSGRLQQRGLETHLEVINRHLHPEAILPDQSVIQIADRGPMVNWIVLQTLGERARNGEDPYFLLREVYAEAERAWDAGEMRAGSRTL